MKKNNSHPHEEDIYFKSKLRKLTSEEVSFALNFPIEDLVSYALDTINDNRKAELEKMFSENVVLANNYKAVQFIIEINNINSLKEYEKHTQKKLG